jgi:hypothetical protein
MARVVTLPRVLMIVVVVAAIVAAVAVLSGQGGPAQSCVGRAQPTAGLSSGLLTPAAGSSSLTTLPPSRDNDAGRSRIPDATPDADNDTSRSRLVCAAN